MSVKGTPGSKYQYYLANIFYWIGDDVCDQVIRGLISIMAQECICVIHIMQIINQTVNPKFPQTKWV